MKFFVRPLEHVLINLWNVSRVDLDRKSIIFTMNHARFRSVMGSVGSDALEHKFVYPTEEVAKQKFEEYTKELSNLR